MKKIYLFIGLFLVLPFYGQQNSLNFDGVDDEVLVPSFFVPNSLSGSNVLTVEAWVKPALANYPTSGAIVSNHGSNTQFALRALKTGYEFFIGFGIYAITTPENSLKQGVWQHIAGVYDGNSIKIYIDGVLQGTNSTGSMSSLPNSSSIVYIGCDGFPDEKFSGDLYDVRIWKKAATDAEITTNMNAVLNGNEANLLALYSFNQGTASGNNDTVTTLHDSYINPNDGILYNFALNGNSSNWLDKNYVALSTKQFDNAVKLNISPNPTSDFVNVEGFNTFNATAEIYDLNGRKLFSENVSQTQNIISLKKLSNGVYFIKIISDKGITTNKVIKK
ncbi:LamG-like jellyroll fold domain-containing protein [Flavobacterium sp.]|uniref:LamG-like jellyroll fold domain-containing protein n=1 Tax=Flavobacterium sp. TaxID=239 RepID=UPI002C1B1645|nr:LamG-like jellyroll fold domain-containing protein [Flavobacterium sp.]HSD05909.1 LamG-like jellyroll fold domain-containing protein [Flavobacterium sp.]